MSLLFGYSEKSESQAPADFESLQLAYKRLAVTCNEKSDEAMKKANSASYRARKADEAARECSAIKTFTTKTEISSYGNPKTIKTFRKGIVLLGIVTKDDSNNSVSSASKFSINYDFYNITGNKHIAVIQGRQKYKILKDEDLVSNIQDVYTNLKPCSISINLMGKDTKSNKPSNPIKLEIIIQYIELSGSFNKIEYSGLK